MNPAQYKVLIMSGNKEDNCCSGESEQLHVAIIGSGSGAFACAIKAAENGARVTMIEGADIIGGCCVNVGSVQDTNPCRTIGTPATRKSI